MEENTRRAEHGGASVAAYLRATGDATAVEAREMAEAPEEGERILSDLLCDLQHWGDARGVDFRAALDRGTGHHLAEARPVVAIEVSGGVMQWENSPGVDVWAVDWDNYEDGDSYQTSDLKASRDEWAEMPTPTEELARWKVAALAEWDRLIARWEEAEAEEAERAKIVAEKSAEVTLTGEEAELVRWMLRTATENNPDAADLAALAEKVRSEEVKAPTA